MGSSELDVVFGIECFIQPNLSFPPHTILLITHQSQYAIVLTTFFRCDEIICNFNPVPTGKIVWQIDVITGLLAPIGSFPRLHLPQSVVCKRHLSPKSFYFAIVYKNII